MTDSTPVTDVVGSVEPPAWAKLICPFRSTNHMIVEPPQQVHLAGLPPSASAGRIQIVPGNVPCIGPPCAIFYSCKPGVAEGGEAVSG